MDESSQQDICQDSNDKDCHVRKKRRMLEKETSVTDMNIPSESCSHLGSNDMGPILDGINQLCVKDIQSQGNLLIKETKESLKSTFDAIETSSDQIKEFLKKKRVIFTTPLSELKTNEEFKQLYSSVLADDYQVTDRAALTMDQFSEPDICLYSNDKNSEALLEKESSVTDMDISSESCTRLDSNYTGPILYEVEQLCRKDIQSHGSLLIKETKEAVSTFQSTIDDINKISDQIKDFLKTRKVIFTTPLSELKTNEEFKQLYSSVLADGKNTNEEAVHTMPVKPMAKEKIPAQKIAHEFIRQYYSFLTSDPQMMYRCYRMDSMFLHRRFGLSVQDDYPVFGKNNIRRRIRILNYRNCHVKVERVEVEERQGNEIYIQVFGECSMNGLPMRRFKHCVLLAPQPRFAHYAKMDTLYYLDEVFPGQDSKILMEFKTIDPK